MNFLFQDARYAWRVLRNRPGFTGIAVTVLALGIGVNTAVFGLANGLLLHPLYGRRSGELVGCFNQNLTCPDQFRPVSYPNYQDLRDQNTVFTGLAAHKSGKVGLQDGAELRQLAAEFISANYFAVLGVNVAQGRPFAPNEERPGGAATVVVVSHHYWRKTGADPGLLGKRYRINGLSYTVVGIAPKEFTGHLPYTCPDLWLPLGALESTIPAGAGKPSNTSLSDRGAHCLLLFGQLKPGVTAARANTELRVLAEALQTDFPVENKDHTFVVGALSRLYDSAAPARSGEVTKIFGTFMVLAGIVLLIGCVNLANLMLARSAARRQEMATRLALGGQRVRIVRQLLTEGLLIALMGGAISLLVGVWTDRLLIASVSRLLDSVSTLPSVAIVLRTGIDWRVLAATLACCVASTFLFGLGPAWKLSRVNLVADLNARNGQDSGSRPRRGLLSIRNLLLIFQIAGCLTLVLVAGLFVRSALNLARVPPGFDLDQGLVIELDLALGGYDEPHGRAVFRTLTERLQALPGVHSVTLAQQLPYGHPSEPLIVLRDGADPSDLRRALSKGLALAPQCNVVGTEYFKSLGARVLRGREFNSGELEPGRPRVAIIDGRLARMLWPGQDVIGKRVRFAGMYVGEGVEIVGLVPELRKSLFIPKQSGCVYLPWGQQYSPTMSMLVRATGHENNNAAALLTAAREAARNTDPHLPVVKLTTWRQFRAASPDELVARVEATLFTVFGALALGLALVGVYGVKAYLVSQRTREIGIRLALGATHGQVIGFIMREALVLTVVGTAVGLLIAAGTTRLLQGALYEIRGSDPLTFTAVPILVVAAALLASYIPCRRVAKVDPVMALRAE